MSTNFLSARFSFSLLHDQHFLIDDNLFLAVTPYELLL